MRSARALIPLLAFALAYVGQLSGLLHVAVVTHAVCTEHGDLVDVDADAGADDERVEDDHCLLALSPALVDASVAPSGAAISDVSAIERAPRVHVLQLEVEPLAVAPKTSPPRG